MNLVEEDKWFNELLCVAQQNFHLNNWTIDSLKSHFMHSYKSGLSPYKALQREGYPEID